MDEGCYRKHIQQRGLSSDATLTAILSGSRAYFFQSHSVPPERFTADIQCISNLLSFGRAMGSRSLALRIPSLSDRYCSAHSLPTETLVSLPWLIQQECVDYIEHSTVWLSADQKRMCKDIFFDWMMSLKVEWTSVSTLYLVVFDNGWCQISALI